MKIDGNRYLACFVVAMSLFLWYIGDFRLAPNPLAQRTADMITVELRMIRKYNSTETLEKNAKFAIRGEYSTGATNEIRGISGEGKRYNEGEIREYYVAALTELGWKYMGETAEYYRGRAVTREHLFEKDKHYLRLIFKVSNWGEYPTNVRIGQSYYIDVGRKEFLKNLGREK
jgi:hypothetical protein